MSTRVTLLTLLGVGSVAEAAQVWPRTTLLPGLGSSGSIEQPSDFEPLIAQLVDAVELVDIRSGSDAGRVGLIADVVVIPPPNPMPIVLRQLPDIGFVLLAGSAADPARLFVTESDAGVEVVIEGLAVEISLPNGLLTPLRSEAEEEAGPSLLDVVQAGPFEAGVLDTYEVVLRELTPSTIKVHVRVRFTEEREVVIEPCVPLAIGPCRFSGLPCRGVHDLAFLPYPTLTGDHTVAELPLEWTRHEISGGLGIDGTGVITVRTLDLDSRRPPLRQLMERFSDEDAAADLEFVLEDLALPVSSWLTPVATHGRFGLRRAVLQGGDEAEAYDLTLAPIEIELPSVVDWKLKIFRLLFESPSTVVVRMAVLFGQSEENDRAMVIEVTDGWRLQGAWLPIDPLQAFTIANADVSLMTAKLGVLLRGIGDTKGEYEFAKHFRLVVDIGISVRPSKNEVFELTTPLPAPGADLHQTVVLRDLGWDYGPPSPMPNLWFPEPLKLKAFKTLEFEVEELAFLNEDNGGRYLAFSGGVALLEGVGKAARDPREPGTPGVPAETTPPGGGIRFRRLRMRTGGNPLASKWMLDGISIYLRAKTLEISGFGTITDELRDGHRYREIGAGLLLRFTAMGKEFSLGAQLYHGRVEGDEHNFTYWLFALQLSYCPVGTVDLRGVRMLVASGMSPDLPEPSGRPQEMRLLEWYQANNDKGAVEVRSDRSQQTGGWKVEQGAQAAGVGADLCLSVSKAVILRAFIFLHTSDSGAGFLVAAEVFLLKGTRPVGVGAIEVDLDRDSWSALIAVDLDLATVLKTESDLVKRLGRLTGSIFAGNDPAMFAIGQLNDQASWLTLSQNTSFLGMRARISLAFCLQIASGDGPRGIGVAVTATAQGSLGIGKVEFYASFGFIAGTWANEAGSSGFVAWAELALRIKVFWVFSFGANVKATFEQLGPQEPNYRHVSLEVRIETPWWLPDVTFRVDRVRETPQPEAMPALSPPLESAGAIEPGAMKDVAVALGALGAAGSLHTIAELRALPPGDVADAAWGALTPVSVDAVLAVNFAVAVGNETTVVQSTPAGAGRQAATAPAENQLSARYTLTQVGVRRRPRYGTEAGVWTDLLAPADSELGGLGDLLADPDLAVRFASALTFRWDADVTRGDVIDPRRLLVNADTPFSFLTSNPAAEEGLLANDPAFPCCAGKRTARVHRVDVVGLPLGRRTPSTMRFSDSTSTWRWLDVRPPIVAASVEQPGGEVARVVITRVGTYTIAVATFDELAFSVEIDAFWRPSEFGGVLVVESGRGLKVVDRQTFPMVESSPPRISVQDPAGITSLAVRFVRSGGIPVETPPGEWLEVRSATYHSVREERDRLADQGRCAARGGLAGGGKLAWLPNTDYELSFTVRTTVDYQGSAQEAKVVQRVGMRTRGLPGLNAVDAPGSELEPYVESVYGGGTQLLYRREPVVLAFDERFSSLLPVDRTPSPSDPAERTQLMEWVLTVAQGDGRRLSVPSADWVVAHRGTAPPPRPHEPRVIDDVLVRSDVRRVPTMSPLRARLETLEALSPACAGDQPRLHASQVLTHAPVDDVWPAQTTLRVAVRAKSGPHVARRPFAVGDETALTVADEGRTTSTGWEVVDGALSVGGTPQPGLRHYATFGDDGWDHVQITAEVSPAGGAAGVAVAIAGLPRVERALLVLVDEAAGELQLLGRRAGVTSSLTSVPLPAAADGTYPLSVLVFDDRVRARVGETVVEVDRGDLRNGLMAVVIDGPGRCSSLLVDGLDGLVTQLQTSRYESFAQHVGSWDGMVRTLPGDGVAVGPLCAATLAEIDAAMTATADAQVRQRLFDRWVGELAVPLTKTVAGLRLHRIGSALLVLESPEPLPLSRDVTLRVTHRVVRTPPAPGVPRPLLPFAAGLRFRRDRVRGPVPATALDLVRRARTLVHAVRRDGPVSRIDLRRHSVRVTEGADGAQLTGELTSVTAAPRPTRIPLGHIVLLDRDRRPLSPPIPLPVEEDVEIDLATLSNAIEDRILLIPGTPLADDTYAFEFGITRPRYRGDPVPYSETVTLSVPLPA